MERVLLYKLKEDGKYLFTGILMVILCAFLFSVVSWILNRSIFVRANIPFVLYVIFAVILWIILPLTIAYRRNFQDLPLSITNSITRKDYMNATIIEELILFLFVFILSMIFVLINNKIISTLLANHVVVYKHEIYNFDYKSLMVYAPSIIFIICLTYHVSDMIFYAGYRFGIFKVLFPVVIIYFLVDIFVYPISYQIMNLISFGNFVLQFVFALFLICLDIFLMNSLRSVDIKQ